MLKQDVAFEIYYDSAWHDLAAAGEVFTEEAGTGPIVIKRGQSDEGSEFRPATISATLDNATDKYRTTNPASALYGKAGLNTPVRVSVAGSVRGVAEAVSWTARQTDDFRASPLRGQATVDVEAGGLLERIGEWSTPLQSTLYTQITSLTTLAAYWPGEDGADATAMSSAYADVDPATTSGITFADSDGPAGSAKLLQFSSTGVVDGLLPATISTTGWQFQWTANLAGADGTERECMAIKTSQGYWWTWNASLTSYRVIVKDSAGTILYQDSTTNGGAAPGENVVFRLKASLSGGTWTVEPGWYEENAQVLLGFTGTFSGTAGRPIRWHASANTVNSGGYIGHVFATTDATESLQTYDMLSAINGYPGETAGDRFTRLMDQLGLSYTVIGDAADSIPMGPQSTDPLPVQLKEIVDTEDALLFDAIDDIALVLLLRAARYNQTPALELIPTDLPALPAEVTDNLGRGTVVTASQRDGGSVTARDDSAVEYKKTVDVNVADPDNDLAQLASWWLRRGTVELPRYPQLVIKLDASPHLIAAVETVDVGSVITITGFREYTVRLYVLGWTETIRTHARTIVFTCAPDRQFVTGEYDDTATRYDSASTTLKTAVSSSATSLTFRTSILGDVWSTTGTPYSVTIAGEEIRVTSMGAASLVSGSYDQAATVVRGTNGISKALTAGDPIHIATPGRWAL